jgi:hypothetical protein
VDVSLLYAQYLQCHEKRSLEFPTPGSSQRHLLSRLWPWDIDQSCTPIYIYILFGDLGYRSAAASPVESNYHLVLTVYIACQTLACQTEPRHVFIYYSATNSCLASAYSPPPCGTRQKNQDVPVVAPELPADQLPKDITAPRS